MKLKDVRAIVRDARIAYHTKMERLMFKLAFKCISKAKDHRVDGNLLCSDKKFEEMRRKSLIKN